ncbi:LacI family DNA-binding transcriptional regulator [Paracoccus aminophilus]|uniref:Transcriptional regulator, LacI family n=1 Tax=Paracoccus aminophilus JCM 7686 TaxID=1367847 RepID=S5Z1T3_PARAH|nr:LacI family DNA-binding transcriptional regulator [Paracoccus aminophilus]AGT11396.1 transcriptional regulator, LacI family [Paracoccus aminophilus JCM 7686]
MSKAKSKAAKSSVSANRVAALAGVSRSAVSRTFTPGASVSAKTRAKVLAAAEELGYHVNHLARGLIQHRSGIVCLIVSEIGAPFQAALIEAVTARLQALGKVVMLLSTAGQPENAAAALRQALNYRAEATVILSGGPPASLIATCIENGQRVILVNRDEPISEAEVVLVQNEAAAREACLMLRRAGCRQLALVSSNAGTPSLVSRERSFLDTAAEHGLSVRISRAGPTGYATGAEAARRLLGATDRPEGVFCTTDLLALGFMDVARLDFRRKIPEDLCLIGFDDIPQAGWRGYDLTTFRQPLPALADRIAASIEGDLEGGEATRVTALPVEIVWRGSLRP